MDKSKLKQLQDLAQLLDAKQSGNEAFLLAKKISKLEDEITKLKQTFNIQNELASKLELDSLTRTLSDAYDSFNIKIEQILSEHRKISKDKDYSDDYFSKEIQSIKKLVSELKLQKGEDGKDYLLTSEDKKEIASLVELPDTIAPTAQKVLETIEIPEETGATIVEKINELNVKPELQIDARHIKGLPKGGDNFFGGAGIKGLRAGTNIAIDNTNLGYPIISSTGDGSSDTLQTVTERGATTTEEVWFNHSHIQIGEDGNDEPFIRFSNNAAPADLGYQLLSTGGNIRGLSIPDNAIITGDIYWNNSGTIVKLIDLNAQTIKSLAGNSIIDWSVENVLTNNFNTSDALGHVYLKASTVDTLNTEIIASFKNSDDVEMGGIGFTNYEELIGRTSLYGFLGSSGTLTEALRISNPDADDTVYVDVYKPLRVDLIKNQDDTNVLDLADRLAYLSNGTVAIDYSGIMRADVLQSFDATTGLVNFPNGISDDSAIVSLDPSRRTLNNSLGTTTVDYENLSLVGAWTIDGYVKLDQTSPQTITASLRAYNGFIADDDVSVAHLGPGYLELTPMTFVPTPTAGMFYVDDGSNGTANHPYYYDGSTWTDLLAGGGVSTGSIIAQFDGGGYALATGLKARVQIPFDCTITGWTIITNVSGSAVVDVWKDTYANYSPTVADSITASAKPTVTTSDKATSTTLTGWTTSVTAGDILIFNIDSCSTITGLTISLQVNK